MLSLVLLPALLLFAGLVVDVGYWFVTDRSAQNAADAAALAAAQELSDNPGAVAAATAKANEFIAANLPGAKDLDAEPSLVDTDITTPYKGDPDKVEVVVRMRAGSFFANLAGFAGVDVAARAVAEKAGSEVPLAVFTKDTDCDFGLKINGNAIDIGGAIHSNGKLEVNGNNIDIGGGAAGGPNACTPTLDGKHITFGDSTQPTAHSDNAAWPREYKQSDYWPASCMHGGPRQKWEFNNNNATIPAGVYCATESFIANANHLKGNITVFAPEIILNGNHHIFTPYVDDLLLYATGTKELKLNANAHELKGNIFHPGGRVVFDGNTGSILTGMVQANEFQLNGNAWDFHGTGESQEFVLALVE